MPRKPRDPGNPLSPSSPQVNVKLPDALARWLAGAAEARGVTKSELARELMERGRMHLAIESGAVDGDMDYNRDVLDRRVEYALRHLEAQLMDHAPMDPNGAVVAARRGARFLAQWADERALRDGLPLAATTTGA